MASRLERLAAWLVRRHPRAFVDAYGSSLLDTLRERAADAQRRGRWATARFALRELTALTFSVAVENGRRMLPNPGVTAGELRYAARRLAAARSFTASAIATLALALGAALTVFTLLHRIVLAPLPYPDADRLIDLDHAAPGVGIDADLGMSIGLYHEYATLPSIESIAIYYVGERTLAGDADPANAEFLHATPSLARVLRAAPALGRWFIDAEGTPGGPKVIVLTDGFWRRRFGASPSALGSTVRVDGVPHEVVGIMPRGFAFPGPRVDFIAPLAVPPRVNRAAGFNYQGIARLAPGVTVDAAREQQNEVIADLPTRYPSDREIESGLLRTSRLASIADSMKWRVVGEVTRTLWVLLGACGIVLLMACANVVNLFLVRAEAAARETVLRRALGADSGALVIYHGAEALLIAAGAGVLGYAFAHVAVSVLVSASGVELPRLHEVRVAGATALATAVGAAAAWALLTAAPLVQTSLASDAPIALRQRSTTAGPRAMRVRQLLVAAQVALALVLLSSAGLLVRSFAHLVRADPGFRTEDRLVFRLGLPGSAFRDRAAAARWHERMLDELRTIHGVRAAAAVSTLPLTVEGQKDPIEVFGRPASAASLPVVRFLRASASFFDTVQTPLRAGRLFDTADARGDGNSVLVNDALARLYFPSEDPIGRRIRPYGSQGDRWLTIVGVVGNTATLSVQEREPLAKLYVPLGASLWADVPSPHEMVYVVHTSGDPLTALPAVQDLLRRSNPELALAGVERFSEVAARSRAGVSFAMVLIALAAVVALVLGIIGVYAVVAYSTAQRRREMAVRLAVGATPADLTRMQVRQGTQAIVAGVLAGLAAAAAAGRALHALLFGITAGDPSTYLAASVLLLTVALVSCWWPARRAARVSPVEALRS